MKILYSYTPIENLQKTVSSTRPDSHSKTHKYTEKLRQTFDVRHSIFGQECAPSRLKLRRRFLSYVLDEPSLREDPPNGVSNE